MDTRADRLKSLPADVLRTVVTRRKWNGVFVDVTEHWGSGEACHELCYEDEARLTGLLFENGGAPCEPRLKADRPCPVDYAPQNLQFAPRGITLWGFCADMRYVKDVTLVFRPGKGRDLDLCGREDLSRIDVPRLRFTDPLIWTPLSLLAGAIDDPDPSTGLYGDALIVAVVARLQGLLPPKHAVGRLAGWQLRRVLEYIEDRSPMAIRLGELAESVGLSQAHFARAFKASTGQAPYRWQLEARIRRAKALLLETSMPLDDVASAMGFADATHFGRRFKASVGASPAAWRRDRRT